jgi:two-component system sensor histidine kinase RstB
MTRLFVRFYLGVLVILLAAWGIEVVFWKMKTDDDSGPLRTARELYESSEKPPDEALEEVQAQFEFPLRVVPIAELSEHARNDVDAGNEVIYAGEHEFALAIVLSDGQHALRYGPIIQPHGPSQTAELLRWGILLLFVAGAIAVLLRPISRQLRTLEQAASAMAEGDFTARVDERRVSSARPLARAFNDMAGRTESLLRGQREMLQAVSHELRTPLARIHFAIDLLREDRDGRELASRLDSLELAADEMDHLVGELLHYVRWESTAVEREQLDAPALVEQILERCASLHPQKDFVLANGPLRPAELAVSWDRRAMERALGNVIGNAARFARSKVEVQLASSPAGVTIDVDDDGPGIPADQRQRVFEPFVRLEEGGRGAGLGLALVRRIVSHLGGAATATDSPLGGCRIRLEVPTG